MSSTQKLIYGYEKQKKIPEPENKDSLPFEIQLVGTLPAVLLLDDHKQEGKSPYQLAICLDDLTAEVHFQMEVLKDEGGMYVGVEDRFGCYSRTHFRMRLVPEKPEGFSFELYNNAGELNINLVVDKAAECLNKLIDAYYYAWKRESASMPSDQERFYNKDWYPSITRANISPIRNIKVYSFSGVKLYEQGHVDFRSQGLGLGTRLSGPQLEFVQDACIGSLVKDSSYYLRLANRFTYSEEREAHLLMLATYVDKRIFEVVRKYLEITGLTSSEIEEKLHKVTKKGPMAINREDALALVFGNKEFKSSKQWLIFDEDLLSIRNEVVHGSVLAINKDQTKRAVEACSELLGYIESAYSTALQALKEPTASSYFSTQSIPKS